MGEKKVPTIPAPKTSDEELEAAIEDEVQAFAKGTLDTKHREVC
mgnify:CR=1 FL=1